MSAKRSHVCAVLFGGRVHHTEWRAAPGYLPMVNITTAAACVAAVAAYVYGTALKNYSHASWKNEVIYEKYAFDFQTQLDIDCIDFCQYQHSPTFYHITIL